MTIVEAALKYRVVTLVLTTMLLFGGISAFNKLGRLEDPEFTIKDAKIQQIISKTSPVCAMFMLKCRNKNVNLNSREAESGCCLWRAIGQQPNGGCQQPATRFPFATH